MADDHLRVTDPHFGARFLVRRTGYVVGVFLVDGKRVFRGLGKAADYAFAPSGRRRTEGQVREAIKRAWQAKREELEYALPQVQGSTRPISKVMGEWQKWAPINGRSEATVEQRYRRMAQQYLAGVGDHPIGEISLEHVDRFKEYLSGRGQAPTTINMRLVRLKAFLRWAQERKYIAELPPIQKVKLARRVPRRPQVEQVREVATRLRRLAFDPHVKLGEPGKERKPSRRERYFYELHWMEFLFVLCCGVRRGGPFYARWEHVYLDQAAMLLEQSKGGEELLFLPGVLVDYLKGRRERYPDHVWLFDNGEKELAYSDPHALTTAFSRHLARLGYAGLKIKPLHGFRANFATVALNELGLDSRTVSKLLAHASFKTTEDSYLADRAMEKRRALEVYEREYLADILVPNLSKGYSEESQPSDILN